MKKKKHLFTVLLLAISLLSTSIPVYAQGNGNADNENSTNEESFEEADRNLMKDLLPGDLDLVELSNKELEDYEIPEVISAKDIKEKEHANRLFAQETDDYSIVYQNKDGSKTMYYFDEPVKYTDENGTVCDKSTKLSESDKDGYAFVSADNNINVYMPEQLDNETGIIEAIDPEPLLFGKLQESGVLKNDITLLLSRHDYRTERQQTVFDLAHHILGHQRIALARPDGRSIDDVIGTILGQGIDEHIQRLNLAYHSHLHDVGLHIVHNCLYLSGNNLGRNIEELLDTQGILHGDAGYRRNGITSQFEYRLDIRLYTRAAGAVGTCNR